MHGLWSCKSGKIKAGRIALLILIMWTIGLYGLCLAMQSPTVRGTLTTCGITVPSGRLYSRETLLGVNFMMTQEMRTHQFRDLFENIPHELVRTKQKSRGQRGGTRRRLWRRFSRPPLPFFSYLRSLHNKVDVIRSHTRYCYEFQEASLLYFTESWLQYSVPDSLFEVPGFTLVRADRDTISGKSKGGGICVHINDKWCWAYSVKCKVCDPNVETLGMTLLSA